jgi:Na+-transporting methylmalonyl-CoA/oxaloacetate decarboxylase gamma subunit
MKKKVDNSLNSDNLSDDDTIQRTIIYFFSYLGIVFYFLSLLIMIFYIKKVSFMKSKSFSFLLLNSITNLFELTIKKDFLIPFKDIIVYISYLFQFHLIISSINRLLSGKQIFKSEKNFSLKKLIYIEIVLPIIVFPYSKFFEAEEYIDFFQYIIIIILLICFYEYVKNKIVNLIKHLNENNRDIIEIAYMEPDELSRVYEIMSKLWFINFSFFLLFYIIKFFDILLKKYNQIHFYISLILIVIKEVVVFLFFLVLTVVVYLLNKSYNKGQIVQTEEDDNNIVNGEKIRFEGEDEENGKKLGEPQKLEIEEDVNIDRNKKKDEYKNIEKSENEDNIIEIENLEISNGKEKKNNEEEKLDEEEDAKDNNYSKETDKLK